MKHNITADAITIAEKLLNKKHGEINEKDTLEQAGIDSILFIQLVIRCEKKFHICFEDEMLIMDKFSCIGALLEYIEERYAARYANG